MARQTTLHNFTPIIDAAGQWLRDAVISDGSLFAAEQLWTPELIQELRRAFVERPDEGGDSFIKKLHGQLTDASPSARRLMGEMLWITLLFPSNVSAGKKREQVTDIWNSGGAALDPSHPLLSEPTLSGIGSGGMGFNNHRWRELVFLITWVERIKQLPRAERQAVINDYDRFLSFTATLPEQGYRQLRHMLRYFAFPDRVERMCSSGERRKVLAAFSQLPERELEKWDDRKLDDAMLTLRQELEAAHPGRILDFYESPLVEKWGKLAPAHKVPGTAGTDTNEGPAKPITVVQLLASYTESQALADLFMSAEQLSEIRRQLSRKKNLVLQGPPGVGKTFAARRLAYLLLGEKDDSRVETVQFHPSTSYEDFVLGLRPDGEGGFALKPGVFHRFCQRARDSARPHVFIIDEINRGNLAKIFGELLMLVEPDKRGPNHAVPLTYDQIGAPRFFLPENLFIIGTMNTADRSLALVDYALRRRFAFINLAPDFGLRFRADLTDRGCTPDFVDRLCERLEALNAQIAADTRSLGPGYRIGHSYFCDGRLITDSDAWLRDIIRYEIQPLLEEYWMDDAKKAAAEVAKLTL